MGIFYGLEGVTLRFSSEREKFSGIRCAAQIVGRNIGATTERLCGSKESLGFPLTTDFGVELRYCKGYLKKRYLSIESVGC